MLDMSEYNIDIRLEAWYASPFLVKGKEFQKTSYMRN
jgi:hypothetical protein